VNIYVATIYTPQQNIFDKVKALTCGYSRDKYYDRDHTGQSGKRVIFSALYIVEEQSGVD
jgi:hypothetical protein